MPRRVRLALGPGYHINDLWPLLWVVGALKSPSSVFLQNLDMYESIYNLSKYLGCGDLKAIGLHKNQSSAPSW